MKIFAERLRELRESNGYSKYRLAREVGVNSSTIFRIETGKIKIRIKTFIKIVTFFNISSDYFLGRINEKKKMKD